MIKSVKIYYKNKIIKCIELILILVIIPAVILAYKPPQSSYCGKLQENIALIADRYLIDSDYSFHSNSPEERFKELYNLLLEKKRVDSPLRYYTDKCSYGLIISDSNELLIYCKYHGNAKNVYKFSHMSSARYSAGKKEGFYLILAFACAILGSIIISIKAAYRKLSKKEVEDIDESV